MIRNFGRELVEDEMIITRYIGTAKNDVDMHTKNESEETFKKHVNKHFMDLRLMN
jgi:hypothetical protein